MFRSNPAYTDEERRRFREEPDYLASYRKEIEHENNGRFTLTTCKDSDGARAAIPKLAGTGYTRHCILCVLHR